MNQFSILVFILLMSAGSFAGRPSAGSSEGAGNGPAASPSNTPNTQNDTAQPDTTAAPTNPQNPQNTATSSGAASNSNNTAATGVAATAVISGVTGAALGTALTGAVGKRLYDRRMSVLDQAINSQNTWQSDATRKGKMLQEVSKKEEYVTGNGMQNLRDRLNNHFASRISFLAQSENQDSQKVQMGNQDYTKQDLERLQGELNDIKKPKTLRELDEMATIHALPGYENEAAAVKTAIAHIEKTKTLHFPEVK
jgi:hypothetical protein